MISLSHRVILAWSWERRLIALLSGACGALAMPPLDLLPALVIPFTAAIWLIDGSGSGRSRVSAAALLNAASIGWWWGFGYFLAGLWWLGAAFLVDADEFLWAMPLGVIGLPAGLALFPALGFAVARLLWSTGPARLFAFAFGLGLSEWLRGHIFTGFPWNQFGQALGDYLVTGQAASLVGVEGLTLLALLIFGAPALVATDPSGRARWRSLVVAGLAFAALVAFGAVRLAGAGGLAPQLDAVNVVEGVKLRVMQPNISMFDKRRALDGQGLLDFYLGLSDKSASPSASSILDATHVVWPESPFPFLLAEQPQALKQIGAKLQGKVQLITGAIRTDPAAAGGRQRFFNAIQIVSPDGSITQSYDKVHLVPFGEYLPAPFRWMLTVLGLRQFVQVPGGFEAGAIRTPMTVAGLPPFLPLICYEAIFPTEALAGQTRPRFLLNVTNDAWFGQTFGPYQHFAQSRLRTIEQGLPLVRAANTGISAVVDPFGRVVRQLPLNVADVIDSPLPKAIAPTIYARFGLGITFTMLMVLGGVALVSAIGGGRHWVKPKR
ncbi:MAG: apolipoprotein N-acyltransferase [Beijerinckiaceae bacterium]|nr:apolipoprotein N-acyltransferase [Beijerinckiaceae bacterium]